MAVGWFEQKSRVWRKRGSSVECRCDTVVVGQIVGLAGKRRVNPTTREAFKAAGTRGPAIFRPRPHCHLVSVRSMPSRVQALIQCGADEGGDNGNTRGRNETVGVANNVITLHNPFESSIWKIDIVPKWTSIKEIEAYLLCKPTSLPAITHPERVPRESRWVSAKLPLRS